MDRTRRRWLIVADSLAMPRPGVPYEHTWPRLIVDEMPSIDWICRAARGATTERLENDGEKGADCLEFYAPDGVILQLGICDCAPRVLRRGALTTRIIHRLPFRWNHHISNWIERRAGRSIPNAWVSPEKFVNHLERYLERAAAFGATVVALHVAPVGLATLQKNPLLDGQIQRYNRLYDELQGRHPHFFTTDPFADVESIEPFLEDGYHLNELGGRKVAHALAQLLRRLPGMTEGTGLEQRPVMQARAQ